MPGKNKDQSNEVTHRKRSSRVQTLCAPFASFCLARSIIEVCRMLVGGRGDMVVKAMSWALRELIRHDAGVVRHFLKKYDHVLAARVKREVNNKLTTGLKNPRQKKKK